MNVRAKLCNKLLLLLAVFLATAASMPANGIDGTATYTDTLASPGVYQYDLTLKNTGTTTIGTFWFSWIPGAFFMSATPTNVMSPAGWSDMIIDGGGKSSIQWTTASPLAMGGSVTSFLFDSTMTPAQIAGVDPVTGDPITTAFLYISAPFGDAGVQITATPAIGATPEASTLSLAAIAMGFLALAGNFRKRTLSRLFP